ncbi:MAG: PP2C family protein-serine/threonine phosphatase [Thermoanaerobaculia bacterium]
MNGKRALALLVIGIIGYALLALLFPRSSTGAQWQVRMDADESIARARGVAAAHGFDVTGWSGEAGVRVPRALQNQVGSRAVQIHVAFRDPRDSDHLVGVRFGADGRPTAVVTKRPPRKGDDITVEAALPIAERAFRGLVPDASAYRSIAQEDLGEQGVRFRWERSSPNPGVLEKATVIVAGNELRDVRYGPELTGKERSGAIDILDRISDAAVIFAVIFGLVLYIIGTGRRLVPQRLALMLAAISSVLLLVELWADLDPMLLALFYEGNASARWTLFLGAAIIAIPVGLALGGGYPSARRRFPRQIIAFEELLLRGRFTSRSTGAAVLTGIAAGGWIVLVPHLIRATRLFGDYRIGDASSDVLFRSGLTPLGIYGGVLPALISFALIVSFVEDKLRGPAGRAIGFLLAYVILLEDAASPLLAALLAGALVTLVFDVLYRRVDLLALIAAAASAAWAIGALTRFAQPVASIQNNGWISVALGAIVALAALATALWGSTKPYLPWEPRPARAERERIEAEFDVARLAQERMLPATPPALPGTSIASFCRPARQVGGDLFDFVTMSDGSVGITVADVSGKGVPAALVMTITKGLLLAASDGRADPLETLADVNAGIHSLGNRSTFVTMLFGVFDPIARTFRFVRAGHTPLLWRKASGEVMTLSPRGIGVGMTSPRMFSAICERATITTGTGDLLILYSDGVNEAMNERHEEFGDERLLAIVRERISSAMSAEEVRAVLVDAVDAFRGTAPAHDDMTLVVVKC